MPNRPNQIAHRVRVDYKAADSAKPAAEKNSNDAGTGNGRIRMVLGLCGVAMLSAGALNIAFSKGSGSAAVDSQLSETALTQTKAASSANSAASRAEIADVKAAVPLTPQFLFAANHTTQPLTISEEVPFLEVDIIDDAVPLKSNVVVGNAIPFTAAASDLANDYTQEPSTLLLVVKKGDTLAGMLARYGLNAAEIASLTNLGDVKKHMTNLQPGNEIQLDLDGSHRVTGITREIDLENTLSIKRIQDNEFAANVKHLPLEKSLNVAELTLESSLFLDGAKAGLSESVIMELFSIFQWTVDFNREVRTGDKLLVLHETYFKAGEKVKDGNILAAEYLSAKSSYNAYRHDSGGKIGYYDSKGQSLEKQFLRNPIEARITSAFNPNRKHPILHTIRAHKGVDYGAPIGTPVSSAGDGKIIFVGPRGSYGNTVEIQHGDRYTTLYAHLHKFPKNLKKGTRVQQGQTIGYVGMTGTATGSHLHYEFRIDGIHRDPQKVKLGGSSPLGKDQLLAFKENIKPLRAQLAAIRTDNDTLAMR